MLKISKSKNKKNNFVDYNIEYAHIYTDQGFGQEQVLSIKKTKEFIKNLEINNKTYSLAILIDDYHPVKAKFDQKKFISNLKKHGLSPDYISLESKLVNYKDNILNLLPAKEAKKLNKYLEKREKLNCSFLIVGWYFLRLGLLPIKNKVIINVSKTKKPFCGKEVVNVLAKKYTDTEENVYRIIRKTIFKDAILKIKKVFY